MIFSIKIMFCIMVLKICMLLMKCKICHFYFTCVNSQSFMNKFFFLLWEIWKRLPKHNTFHKQLITWYNGLQDNVKSITLELSLFPFLFPHGQCAHDGKISIHEYSNFRTSALFSPLTMYKPYLLIMYDLQQSKKHQTLV